ncbi:MAG: DUF362 domain-containing protein [Candidatus Helarchaeota archaeon]|nr:DUF362 domain-containing protein [Candidatus Helarchaeota archaeon]
MEKISAKVAIVKGKSPSEMIRAAFQHFNNFKGKIKGKKIIIKPNLGAWSTILPRHTNEWVVTSKDVLMATISLVKELGASSVTVAEGAFIDIDIQKIYKDMGLKKELKEKNIDLVDLTEGPFQKIELYDNVSVEISAFIINAECLINMPMLKTHGLTTVSLGMKNLKGTLSDQSKRIFHRKGLEKSIAHLSSIIKPTINIVDGLIGLEGLGPMQTGKPIKVGVIIVGDNLVATDAVAASIMGFNPEEIPHIKLANKLGNGPITQSSIDLLGETIESSRVPFEPAPSEKEAIKFFKSSINIGEDQIELTFSDHWCSTCFMNCVGSIWALSNDAGSGIKIKPYIIADQREIPEEYNGQLILFGNCQAKNKAKLQNGDYIFIKGCPPKQMSVYTTLGKAFYSRKRFIWGMLKRLIKGKKLSWFPHWKEELQKE